MSLAPRYTASAVLALPGGGSLTLAPLEPGLQAQLAPYFQGPPGPAGAGLTHTQATPSDLWTVAHNLGTRPAVATFSVGGVEMWGTVMHLSTSVLQISFLTPVAGTARIN
jgi:hypothetical protein